MTVRIGRRVVDLCSGNSVLRAWWRNNCINRGSTMDNVALWKWGRVQRPYPGSGGLGVRMGQKDRKGVG